MAIQGFVVTCFVIVEMAEAEATEAIVSKRLIISGLMPAIDANTLTQRLSSFGRVHSLVGVGMLDANGKNLF